MTTSPSPDVLGGPYLKVEEVATMLRVSRMSIYRLVNDSTNPLGAVKIGGNFRIPESGLRAYLSPGLG